MKDLDKDSDQQHPFGGCNKLLTHYQTIGTELLQIESSGAIGSFREGVAFVPVEVLESYLEDLLDLGVKEDTLSIYREHHWLQSWWLPVVGFSFALGFGLYAASTGATLAVSFSLTLFSALPFGLLFHFSPRIGLMRRVSFAQILSGEISRRRGRDKDGDVLTTRVLREVLGGGVTRAPLQGAAKKLFH